jgi:hypothetical protein
VKCLKIKKRVQGVQDSSECLGFSKMEGLSHLQRDMGKVERMLKALRKSLENKHLNP